MYIIMLMLITSHHRHAGAVALAAEFEELSASALFLDTKGMLSYRPSGT